MGKIYDEMIKETELLFQNSKSVKYWPYIGKGYFKCATKILVLGESHYLTDPSRVKEMENYSGWTNEVIIWAYLNQEYCQNFSSFDDFPKWISLPKNSYLKGFRNTAKMLVQSIVPDKNLKLCSDYVWKNLAFYNFFQRPVACRPGCHEWLMADYNNYIKQARAALDEVMDLLKPDVVIVWGKGVFYKKWLPSDMAQRYPKVNFFPINHPSYNIKQEYIDKWKNFVKQHKINEQYTDYHLSHKRIESIFNDKRLKDCFKRIKSFFPKKRKENDPDTCCCWFSERSIGYWLCLDANDSNAMIVLAIIDENGEMSINFSTRHGNELISALILNHPSFDAFTQKRNLNCDGIFELCRVGSNADDDFIVSSIKNVLESVENFGKSFMMKKFF